MTGDVQHPACPRTDAALAIYLDGDVGAGEGLEGSGFELVCGDSLRDHVRACASCRSQLLRARRLDALLAAKAGGTAVGRELDALASRWFAALAAPPRPAATASSPSPRRARAAAFAAVLVLLPLLLAVLSGRTRTEPGADATAAPAPVPAPAAAPITEPAAPPLPTPAAAPEVPGEILIADDAARRRAQQPRRDADRRPAEGEGAAGDLRLAQAIADASLDGPARLAAMSRLAAAARGSGREPNRACRDLLEALAGLGDHDGYQRSLHRRALDLVRGDAQLLELLLAQLHQLELQRGAPTRDDVALVVVAARLGEPRVDAALLRGVRRHPPLAEPLAAALRSAARPSGAASLLLGAWQDLVARGDLGVDDAGPAAWFRDQGEPVFDELVGELERSRSEPVRVRCLLALGHGSDERSLATLLEHLQRAPFDQAHAAAFALSQRPRRQLLPLVALARADDMYLLRAALARAAVPAAAAWTTPLGLGAAERALLASGTFPDFPRVASWFRDRAVSLGD